MNYNSKNTYTFLVILIGSLSLLFSCFEEDERLFPLPPGDETVYVFEKSIYHYHSYFDFSADSATAVSANGLWQIEFSTADSAWEIRVNSSAYYLVYPTGDTAFTGISPVTDPKKYLFDASSGNPDSCSFSTWLDRSVSPFKPTSNVFLIGQDDGNKVKPKWKIRIDNVSNTSYTFTYAVFPAGVPVTVSLPKLKNVNFLQYDFVGKSEIQIEPEKANYDLLFTQYRTTLYDDNGDTIAYYVRGILLNPLLVEASLDTLHSFAEITYDLIKDKTFSRVQDVIGHEWKDVKVDPVTNTFEYFVNTKLNWLIRDTEGYIYKMRFKEFYNSQAEVGYTTIEFQRL